MFLVSWRNAGAEQGKLTWDDYLEQGVLTAIDVGARRSPRPTRSTRSGSASAARCWPARWRCWPRRGEHPAASMTLLTTMLDFTDTGEIGLLVTKEGVGAREAAIGKGGLLKGSELAQVFAVAAGQRPDLAVRRQGLPEGPGRRPRSTCSTGTATTPTCPARCSAGTSATPTWRTSCASPARDQCSSASRSTWRDRRAGVRLRLEGGPHRAVEDGLREHAVCRRRRHLRARRQRAHRRGDQPAGQEEAQLLGARRRCVDADPDAWFEGAEKVPGQLVADLVRVARAARRRPGRRAARSWATPSSPPIEPAPGSYVKEKAE